MNEDIDDYTRDFAQKDSDRAVDLAKVIIAAAAQLKINQ